MEKIREIKERGPVLDRALEIWEGAVRATHHFLTPADVEALKPEVAGAIGEIPCLRGYFADDGTLLGFAGVDGDKLEMLFVDAAARGKGVGKQLLDHAIASLGVRRVDVNEDNEQGAGFYRYMGFSLEARDPLDSGGRPFPILHMVLDKADEKI